MPGSLLEQAHKALVDTERAEAEEQVKLAILEEQDQRLHQQLERAKVSLDAADAHEAILAARERLEDLSRTRETLLQQKGAQAQIVRKCHGQVQTARRIYEEIKRRVTALKELLRQEEHTLAEWQRRVSEAEVELARCHQMLNEVQAGLARVRAELARVAGP